MRLRDWLWPELWTAGAAAMDCERIAKAIYVVAAIEALCVLGLVTVGRVDGTDFFGPVLGAMIGFSLARKVSRAAAFALLLSLILGFLFTGLAVAGVAFFADDFDPWAAIVYAPVSVMFLFLAIRACHATRAYHDFLGSWVDWKAVAQLCGLSVAYIICAVIVTMGTVLQLETWDARFLDGELIEGVFVYSFAVQFFTLPFLASWRVLPGTFRLAVVQYPGSQEPLIIFSDNLMVRHWRGELALGRSFWVNFAGINITLFASLMVFGWVDWRPSTDVTSAVIGIGMTVLVYMMIWQVVGCWRSASRQRASGRGVLAGRAVQIALVLLFMPAIPWMLVLIALVLSGVLPLSDGG